MSRSSLVVKRGGNDRIQTKRLAVVDVPEKTTRSKSIKVTKKTTESLSSKSAPIRSPKIIKKPVKKSTSKTVSVKPKVSNSPVPKEIIQKIKPTINIKRNPLGHLLVEKMLREAGFRGGISTQKELLDAYSTDESIFSIRPQVVLQPKNRRDVEIATAVIARETKRFTSLSLTPRSAGTGLGGGSLTDSIVIDMCAHLNHFGEVVEKKDKITFTCEPGVMWREVEKRLKRHSAYLPPYPASKDICSIGGSLGNNSAGPDSLRHGHCADWIESLDVVLHDGFTYTIKPLTYREFSLLIKQDHEHARIAREIFELISKNEKEIKKGKPATAKNNAGYPLWQVLPEGVAKFKKGTGVFDLTRLIAGSQGTIGIIVNITMRALPIPTNTTLIAVPIFNLEDMAITVEKALKFSPINLEVFDALTFDLAMRHPNFFKKRLSPASYYRVMFALYSTYHVRFSRKIPEFTMLITIDHDTTEKTPPLEIASAISGERVRARVITNKIEAEMLWQVRRASYSLSKLMDPQKRPAAFLEDMTVPPENLSKFFVQIKAMLKEFNVTATIHGHGGNGHFHFYPLLDFTQKTTPALVEKMAEKFFTMAVKFKGSLCGEHNDGIVRTPHLNKMFSKKMLELFKATEHIFDPDDIFNPGKKVNPRFDIKSSMRHTN
jgi:FAD/FMN-containing dehydrogenase